MSRIVTESRLHTNKSRTQTLKVYKYKCWMDKYVPVGLENLFWIIIINYVMRFIILFLECLLQKYSIINPSALSSQSLCHQLITTGQCHAVGGASGCTFYHWTENERQLFYVTGVLPCTVNFRKCMHVRMKNVCCDWRATMHCEFSKIYARAHVKCMCASMHC